MNSPSLRRARPRHRVRLLRNRSTLAFAAWCSLGYAWSVPTAHAQPAPQPTSPPAAPPVGPSDAKPPELKLQDLPPPFRLGARAELLRQQLPVVPVLVLVPNAASYVEAIARWTPRVRFPVLIDNGSIEARQDIARFTRGFEPKSVVRWNFSPKPNEWPDGVPGRQGAVDRAVNRAWAATPELDAKGMVAYWKSIGIVPPGLVVANMEDSAWTAAVALAAGRAQPIAWIKARQNINNPWPMSECDVFDGQVRAAAIATGLAWDRIGDDLDAIALCLHIPSKVALVTGGRDGGNGGRPAVKEGDHAATTDRIGRLPEPADHSVRWAWSSQVFGSEPRAAYRAMCSLFIRPRSAWLFDGYQSEGQPWALWDCTQAAEVLQKADLHVTLDDSPKQGRADWRARTIAPLDAGVVLVNSMGNCDFFDLKPGRGRPGDTPLLLVPSMVHMVHSWSAQFPAIRETVGGRWMDAGAYVYFGSVQEPFLGAFVPTPNAAARLCAGAAWAAAMRLDQGPMWKLASFGDPLATLGPAAPRSDAPASSLGLAGSIALEDELRDTLKDKRFALAIADLELLGRDNDAGRLAAAVMHDQPAEFTADAAAASIFPLVRSARHDLVAAAYEKLSEKAAADGLMRDALWAAAAHELPATTDRALLELLRKHLRAEQPARDAADLAPTYARIVGKPEAMAMLTQVRSKLTDQNQQREADAAMAALR